MPTIPVPLAKGDADALLNLQAAFESVYDASGYGFYLKYDGPIQPPLREQDQAFISEALARHKAKPDSEFRTK